MNQNPEDKPDEKSQIPQISLARKIIIWIFIIGFWVIFYWYKTPSKPDEPQDPAKKQTLKTPVKEAGEGK